VLWLPCEPTERTTARRFNAFKCKPRAHAPLEEEETDDDSLGYEDDFSSGIDLPMTLDVTSGAMKIWLYLGCPSKLFRLKTTETGTETIVSALSERKRLFQLFRFYTETEIFGVSIEPKQTEECDRVHILVFFSENLGLFRFVLVCFETVCFGCFGSIPKERDSMFQLNRNKQKTNRNSVIESIFWYFSENVGLFRFVSVCFETVLFVSVVSI
jgi:hypothetical protein